MQQNFLPAGLDQGLPIKASVSLHEDRQIQPMPLGYGLRSEMSDQALIAK
jgi:hypothetical protein